MEKRKSESSKWVVPVVAVAGGGVYFAAALIRGDLGLGVEMLLIMAGYAAVLLVAGRIDVVRVLRGQFDDERYRSIELRARAFSAGILVVVLLGGFVYELARGEDGQPYALLCAAGAFSYLAALVWQRYRS